MLTKLKDNLLYIGLVIFTLTSFLDHIFQLGDGLVGFLKGLSCGLNLAGIFILMRKQKRS